MIALLCAAALADWAPRLDGARFVVATELLLPQAARFDGSADRSFETRSWQLRAVLSCREEEASRKRSTVGCGVDGAALQASAFRPPGDDPAATAAVLEEHVALLRKMRVLLVLTPRGRRTSWTVEGEPQGSQRDTELGQHLGRALERAVAGLVLERPAEVLGVGGQWVETTSPLAAFPMLEGAKPLGASTVLHQVRSVGERVVVDGVITGTMLDPVSNQQLSAEGRLVHELDPVSGALQTVTWSLDASVLGDVVLHHAGWARRLDGPQGVPLGPTRQVLMPGGAPEGDLAGLPEWPEL